MTFITILYILTNISAERGHLTPVGRLTSASKKVPDKVGSPPLPPPIFFKSLDFGTYHPVSGWAGRGAQPPTKTKDLCTILCMTGDCDTKGSIGTIKESGMNKKNW